MATSCMTEREHSLHHQSSYDCVDVNPDVVPGGAGSTDGALFQYVVTTCNGLQCPPYQVNRVVSCAVVHKVKENLLTLKGTAFKRA